MFEGVVIGALAVLLLDHFRQPEPEQLAEEIAWKVYQWFDGDPPGGLIRRIANATVDEQERRNVEYVKAKLGRFYTEDDGPS